METYECDQPLKEKQCNELIKKKYIYFCDLKGTTTLNEILSSKRNYNEIIVININ